MSDRQQIHGKGSEEDEDLPLKPPKNLPNHRDLTGDVPSAPDPDLGPSHTEDVQKPPGREEESGLPG